MMQKKSTFFFINDNKYSLSTLYTSQFFRILSFFEMSKAVVAGVAVVDVLLDFLRENPEDDVPPPEETLDGRAFRCKGEGCRRNLSYRRLGHGVWYCRDCTIVCRLCKKTVYGDQRATDLFEGLCIDCTRCADCNLPMWDYVCSCSYSP